MGERVAAPPSKKTGTPASLTALSFVDARTPLATLAKMLGEGALGFRHVFQYPIATWPKGVVMLRIGVMPVALGSLGLLGGVYLLVV
ncbi:hypothetical protein [Pyrobaculum sp.]|uniref:hypothetical protein n=1 Tax=Pyrobaculum sp. TaxID=2004705 RepID=UPI0031791517